MIQEILPYLTSPTLNQISNNEWGPTQFGFFSREPLQQEALEQADLLVLGCGEFRGQYPEADYSNGPDHIRYELYQLHNWYPEFKLLDLGNIRQGLSLADTRAALLTILSELKALNKRVLILGGSHDLTLSQYETFKQADQLIDFTVVDMLADVSEGKGDQYHDHLLTSLTSVPNFVRQFNLIGFQSYYVNPNLIETLDKLRFDCVRVGKAREAMHELEPLLRQTHLLSLDMNAVRFSDAPANKFASPNGFYGDEICKLTRYAGMSSCLESIGIYGYQPEHDHHNLTAKLIAQMIWYLIDGFQQGKLEAPLNQRDQFFEYHISFTDQHAIFLKSKRSGRWWMQIAEDAWLPCSYADYLSACNNEIPERWLREMERRIN